MYKVLVIDDEKPIRDSLKGVLEDEGYQVYTAEDGISGVKLVREVIPDVVLLDIWMPGKDGVEALKEIKDELPQIPVIMMSGHGTIETAVKTTKIGSYDFIEKPISLDRLTLLIENAIKYQKLLYENRYLKEQLKKDFIIIAESPKMKKLLDELNSIINTNLTIVFLGEEGTGKEFLAKMVHNASKREGNFVEINCFNQWHLKPNNLMEKIYLAKNGTLYIKDFKNLTQEAQEIILNHIDDLRLILSCTDFHVNPKNTPIKILHNVSNIILNIPPLRERKEDIKPLLIHFVEYFSENYNKRLNFSRQSLETLEKYSWPGNIKELKNFVEQMYMTSKTNTILQKDLPEYILMNGKLSIILDQLFHHNLLKEAKRTFEREFIKYKLIETSGNIKKTSEIIGVSERYLSKMIKMFSLDKYVK
ncbi:MAG: sigma-54 dependent transcriptional regulator [Proteobacteria bacterium]|nr:sigma-54 dependent transcriptional regulator [Pseudomonadota bacterium]